MHKHINKNFQKLKINSWGWRKAQTFIFSPCFLSLFWYRVWQGWRHGMAASLKLVSWRSENTRVWAQASMCRGERQAHPSSCPWDFPVPQHQSNSHWSQEKHRERCARNRQAHEMHLQGWLMFITWCVRALINLLMKPRDSAGTLGLHKCQAPTASARPTHATYRNFYDYGL